MTEVEPESNSETDIFVTCGKPYNFHETRQGIKKKQTVFEQSLPK